MDVTLAKAILNEAKEGGYYAKELPDVDVELFEEAQYFLKEARLAAKDGWGEKNEHIRAIIALGEQANGKKKEEKSLIEKENFPIPPDLEGDPLEMPRDLTKLDDLKIRRLFSEYNAYLARATWVLALEQADFTNATHMRNEAYREAFNMLERIDPETSKPKSAVILDWEAKNSDKYIEWAGKANKHEVESVKLKALKDIFGGNVDRLSRDMTFRQHEWEKSK